MVSYLALTSTATITRRRQKYPARRTSDQQANSRVRTRSRLNNFNKSGGGGSGGGKRLRVFQRRRQNISPTTFRPAVNLNDLRTSTFAPPAHLPQEISFSNEPVAEPLIQLFTPDTTTEAPGMVTTKKPQNCFHRVSAILFLRRMKRRG